MASPHLTPFGSGDKEPVGAGVSWRDTPGPRGPPCPQLREAQVTELASPPSVPCTWVAPSWRPGPAGQEEPQGDPAAGALPCPPGPPSPTSLGPFSTTHPQGPRVGRRHWDCSTARPRARLGHRWGRAPPLPASRPVRASGRWGRGAGAGDKSSAPATGQASGQRPSLQALPGLAAAGPQPGQGPTYRAAPSTHEEAACSTAPSLSLRPSDHPPAPGQRQAHLWGRRPRSSVPPHEAGRAEEGARGREQRDGPRPHFHREP